MSDLTYRLIVDMGVHGSLAPAMDRVGSKAAGLDSAFKRVRDSAAELGSTLSNAFTAAVEKAADIGLSLAKVGAVAAGGALTYGVVSLNNELEKTQISLAAIFGANGQSNDMRDGMLKAGDVMKDMRKDAAALPGEFKDLIGIFRNASIPGFQAGMDINQLRAMSAKVMAAAAVTGVPMEQASREFAMLMEGRAGAHNVLGLRLAGLGGDKAEAFNKSSGADRVKTLNSALEKFAPAIDTYSTSFDGLSSTMLDNAKKFLGATTAGLFERVKIAMKDANAWFDAHEGSIMRLADKIGEKLNYAFEVGREKILEWGPPILVFAANAKDAIADIWNSIEPILERLGPKMKAALMDPGTIDHMRDVLKLYGAVKIGTTLAPAMSGIGNLASGLGGMGGIELAAAAGPLAALLIAAAGAMSALSDETSYFHDSATAAWQGIKADMGDTVEHLGQAFEKLEPLMIKVAEAGGTVLLQSLENTAYLLSEFAAAINLVVTVVGDGIDKINQKINFFTGYMIGDLNKDPQNVPNSREPFSPMSLHATDATAAELDKVLAKTKTGAGGGGGGTHIQKVEIVVSSNQDPSRIARLTREEFENLARNPTSSPFVRNFSAVRT